MTINLLTRIVSIYIKFICISYSAKRKMLESTFSSQIDLNVLALTFLQISFWLSRLSALIG